VVARPAEAPADASTLARYHLKRLDGRLGRAPAQARLEVPTRAHLEECQAGATPG
jgi:hypothetical protein